MSLTTGHTYSQSDPVTGSENRVKALVKATV
jgi:hypothetical protein